jgi:hypothetical protein
MCTHNDNYLARLRRTRSHFVVVAPHLSIKFIWESTMPTFHSCLGQRCSLYRIARLVVEETSDPNLPSPKAGERSIDIQEFVSNAHAERHLQQRIRNLRIANWSFTNNCSKLKRHINLDLCTWLEQNHTSPQAWRLWQQWIADRKIPFARIMDLEFQIHSERTNASRQTISPHLLRNYYQIRQHLWDRFGKPWTGLDVKFTNHARNQIEFPKLPQAIGFLKFAYVCELIVEGNDSQTSEWYKHLHHLFRHDHCHYLESLDITLSTDLDQLAASSQWDGIAHSFHFPLLNHLAINCGTKSGSFLRNIPRIVSRLSQLSTLELTGELDYLDWQPSTYLQVRRLVLRGTNISSTTLFALSRSQFPQLQFLIIELSSPLSPVSHQHLFVWLEALSHSHSVTFSIHIAGVQTLPLSKEIDRKIPDEWLCRNTYQSPIKSVSPPISTWNVSFAPQVFGDHLSEQLPVEPNAVGLKSALESQSWIETIPWKHYEIRLVPNELSSQISWNEKEISCWASWSQGWIRGMSFSTTQGVLSLQYLKMLLAAPELILLESLSLHFTEADHYLQTMKLIERWYRFPLLKRLRLQMPFHSAESEPQLDLFAFSECFPNLRELTIIRPHSLHLDTLVHNQISKLTIILDTIMDYIGFTKALPPKLPALSSMRVAIQHGMNLPIESLSTIHNTTLWPHILQHLHSVAFHVNPCLRNELLAVLLANLSSSTVQQLTLSTITDQNVETLTELLGQFNPATIVDLRGSMSQSNLFKLQHGRNSGAKLELRLSANQLKLFIIFNQCISCTLHTWSKSRKTSYFF